MEYEIVNLEEKKAVGISAVTNNKSPEDYRWFVGRIL